MKKNYFLIIALIITAFGFGQGFNGVYNLSGANGNTANLSYNGTAITNLTVSSLTKVGVTTSPSTGNSRATNWPLSPPGGINLAKYYQFTITAAAGKTITNPKINFGLGRSGTGPRSFQWRSSVDNYATPINITTFNSGLTTNSNVFIAPDQNSSWTANTVSLTTSGQTSITFRLYAHNAEETGGTGGLQGNLSFDGTLVTAGCASPSAAISFGTPSIGGNSATVKWTRGSGNNVLVIMRQGAAVNATPSNGTSYNNSNSIFGDPTAVIGTGNNNFVVYNGPGTSVDVTGLTELTNYHYAVYEYATSGNCYASALTASFTTRCDTVTSTPFTENFEGGVVPSNCWTTFRGANNVGVSEDWKISASGEGRAGTLAARVNNENLASGTSQDWLVTPALDLSVSTNNQLTFYAKDFFNNAAPPPTPSTSSYTIRVSTTSQTDIVSFNTVATYSDTNFGDGGLSYLLKTVDLSSYDGQAKVYIAFVMEQSGFDGDVWFLDDVSVSGSCSPPSSQASAYNTTNIDGATGSATLNWIPSDINTNVLVVVREAAAITTDPTNGISYNANTTFGTPATQLGAGYVVYNGSSNNSSISITNLSPQTTYYVAIYEYNPIGNCYNLTQLTGVFEVSCPTQSLPFTENFDSGSLPTCWSVFDNGIGNVEEWTVINDPIGSSPFAANIRYESGSFGISQDWLVTPPIDMTTVTDSELSFSYRDDEISDYNSTLAIWISTTTDAIGQFQMIPNEQYNEDTVDNDYKLKTINLAAYAGETIYIAFVMEQDLLDGGDSWYVDDVTVNEIIPITNDLIFSEYVEGSSNNKYLEIYNPTTSAITLSNYSIELYTNGSPSATNVEDFSSGFPTALGSGEVLVLRNAGANIYSGTTFSSSVCNFNGDDAVVLKKSGTIIDIIGNIGCDPGTKWNAGGNSTENATIIRIPDICSGVGSDPANSPCSFPTLATEWTSSSIDDVSNLGVHSSNCIPTVGYVYTNGWLAPAGDPSGVATEFDTITIIAGIASITAPTTSADLTINLGSVLNILENGSLDVSGNLINSGTLNLQSISTAYSSIIVNSTSGSGTYNYNRYVNSGAVGGSGGNDLISAPFSGQSFVDFKSANPTSIRTNTNGTLNLFGPFDKTTGTYLTYANDVSTTLAAGLGYRAASVSGSTFMFSGTMNTGAIDVPISIGGPHFATWNLIGNPYPSYIKLSSFLASNSSKFDASNGGVYGYNGTSGGYEIWNDAYALLNPNALIAPGQGFLVASNSALVDINFTPTMRSTGASDDFIAGRQAVDESIAYLQIKAAIASKEYTTDFYFTDFASRGQDANFDSGVFGNDASSTAIYSQLAQNNAGIDMGIQSLAYTDLGSDVRIPLGINAPQGLQITINMVNTILPNGIDVYLEDSLTNVFTLLNTSAYVFTPNSNLTNTGRFFLRFTDNTLSTETLDLDQLQIYALNQTLFINGLLNSATNVTLYDIQGRNVLSTGLKSGSTTNRIDVSKMSTGVYIVKLNSGTQQKTQRVIIK